MADKIKLVDTTLRDGSHALRHSYTPEMVQAIAVSAPTNVVEGIFVIGIMIYIGIRANIDNNFFESLPVIASFLVGAIRLLPSMGRISNNMNNFHINYY